MCYAEDALNNMYFGGVMNVLVVFSLNLVLAVIKKKILLLKRLKTPQLKLQKRIWQMVKSFMIPDVWGVTPITLQWQMVFQI